MLLDEFYEDDRYNNESDDWTDAYDAFDQYILQRHRTCWVCGGCHERTDAAYKVFCWEDFDRFIIRDRSMIAADSLAMQALVHFHQGQNNEISQTFHLSRNPLCSALHLICLPRPWLRDSLVGLERIPPGVKGHCLVCAGYGRAILARSFLYLVSRYLERRSSDILQSSGGQLRRADTCEV